MIKINYKIFKSMRLTYFFLLIFLLIPTTSAQISSLDDIRITGDQGIWETDRSTTDFKVTKKPTMGDKSLIEGSIPSIVYYVVYQQNPEINPNCDPSRESTTYIDAVGNLGYWTDKQDIVLSIGGYPSFYGVFDRIIDTWIYNPGGDGYYCLVHTFMFRTSTIYYGYSYNVRSFYYLEDKGRIKATKTTSGGGIIPDEINPAKEGFISMSFTWLLPLLTIPTIRRKFK